MLTPAQKRFLQEVATAGTRGLWCIKSYAPAVGTVGAGLAEWHEDDEYGGYLTLTTDGMIAVAKPSRRRGVSRP